MCAMVFFHGMESSPQGIKARLIKERYPFCRIPPLTPDIHERARVVEALIDEPSYLIGSSLGGLSAVFFAMKHPDLVKRMILLAPAVGFYDTGLFNEADTRLIKRTYIPAGIRTVVIAGKQDNVIPMTDIQNLLDRSPDPASIRLIQVDDDHGLNGSLDLLMNEIDRMLSE